VTPHDHIALSRHAREQIVSRFAPPDPLAFAAELLAGAHVAGVDRRGHHVLACDRAVIVAAQDGLSTVIVTVMPAGWPTDLVGTDYQPTDNLPATPASIAALATKYGRR
jgi:hypothetical protein